MSADMQCLQDVLLHVPTYASTMQSVVPIPHPQIDRQNTDHLPSCGCEVPQAIQCSGLKVSSSISLKALSHIIDHVCDEVFSCFWSCCCFGSARRRFCVTIGYLWRWWNEFDVSASGCHFASSLISDFHISKG